ncbi:MAG TPA: YXWGXW repeat-containing protein, partial [Hanamia sp.]|nr:YXWGXW repeat-containing protein [Hanamia sp.]
PIMKNINKLFMALLITIFTVINANAQVSLSIRIGPPPLPVYEQPYCPGPGYLWIPGYWAYSDGGYYWVPGYWALPPEIGFYWTPGYCDYSGPYYRWHAGYWGRTVGYYGGIDYGYGYGGRGYYGGRWNGRTFMYNTVVTRVNTSVVHNTYVNRTVVTENTIVNNKRASFNGRGGVSVKPTRQELAAARETHLKPTAVQVSHRDAAKADRRQFASVNKGRPATLVQQKAINNHHAATPKNRVKQNANAHRTITNRKSNITNNRKSSIPQKTITRRNTEKRNQVDLRQQPANTVNERKQSVAKQKDANQMNTNNERRIAIRNQQPHVRQLRNPPPPPRPEHAPRRDDNKERH